MNDSHIEDALDAFKGPKPANVFECINQYDVELIPIQKNVIQIVRIEKTDTLLHSESHLQIRDGLDNVILTTKIDPPSRPSVKQRKELINVGLSQQDLNALDVQSPADEPVFIESRQRIHRLIRFGDCKRYETQLGHVNIAKIKADVNEMIKGQQEVMAKSTLKFVTNNLKQKPISPRKLSYRARGLLEKRMDWSVDFAMGDLSSLERIKEVTPSHHDFHNNMIENLLKMQLSNKTYKSKSQDPQLAAKIVESSITLQEATHRNTLKLTNSK